MKTCQQDNAATEAVAKKIKESFCGRHPKDRYGTQVLKANCKECRLENLESQLSEAHRLMDAVRELDDYLKTTHVHVDYQVMVRIQAIVENIQ